MNVEIRITSVLSPAATQLDEAAATEIIIWCLEPLGELPESKRAPLHQALRETLKLHKGVTGIAKPKTALANFKEIEKRASQLQQALSELDPQYATVISSMRGKEAPDLSTLPDELRRLVEFAQRGLAMGPPAEGAPSKALLRMIVNILMRSLYEATGDWPDGAKKKSGNFEPHLKGPSGEVIRRFFERVDKHVTIGSLVAAVKAGRQVFLEGTKN
jgi:hypothetical protein